MHMWFYAQLNRGKYAKKKSVHGKYTFFALFATHFLTNSNLYNITSKDYILGNMQDALETFSNFCVKTFTVFPQIVSAETILF